MTGRQRRWLAAALGFSLAIRLALLAAVLVARGGDDAFHTSDSARYLALGATLARWERFGIGGEPELFRLPGFPMLVALGTWLGHATYATIALHAVLGAVTTWLCFLWARSIGGPRAGIRGAWLYALEPGQWIWSTLVLTETLFTTLLAAAGLAATTYLKDRRRLALLGAVAAAAACAYVRLAGYVLPFVILLACVVLATRGGAADRRAWRDAAAGMAVAVVLLGAWHVRNGVTAGYWGFSTQLERAAFITAGGVLDSRTGGSYAEAASDRRRQIDEQAHRPPSEVARDMRRNGLARIADAPVAFLSTYAAGIAATLVHPGTGGAMRLFTDSIDDHQPSLAQMLTLGRFSDASRIAAGRGAAYWLVTAILSGATVIYVGLFVLGAWNGRRSPAVLLAGAMAAAILALSGGPDGDSRRRAPLVPIMCVVAAALPTTRSRLRMPTA